MNKKTEKEKESLREQIKFLKSFLKSFEDIKAGRIYDYEFSDNKD